MSLLHVEGKHSAQTYVILTVRVTGLLLPFLFYKLPFMRDDPLLENLKPVVLKDYNGEDVGERKGKSKPGTRTVSITYV